MATRGWRTEDWMAVFLGFLIIVVVLAFFNTKAVDLRNAVSSFRWTTQEQIAARAPAWIATLNGIAKEASAKGQKDTAAMATALTEALEKNDRKAINAAAGKLAKLGIRSRFDFVVHLPVRESVSSNATWSVCMCDNNRSSYIAGYGFNQKTTYELRRIIIV